jgi:uncharacterized membrane protein YobD (UPF0266 family)
LFENDQVIIFTTKKIIYKEKGMFYKNININFEDTYVGIELSPSQVVPKGEEITTI